jgi:transposase
MRAYSMDLRERVLRDSDTGMLADVVAERSHVSGSWVRWLKPRRRETGEVGPRPRRYGPRRKLEPHVHTLAALIQEQPDRTLAEVQEALGLPVSLPTICRAVQQLGLRVKKNRTPQRARPA